MFSNRQFWLILAAAFAAALGLFFGAKYFSPAAVPTFNNAKLYPRPRELAAFTLQTSQGAAFNVESLRGQWSVLFFGFTHCPDVCPTTLQEFKKMMALPQFAQLPRKPKMVFVSVDPERDQLQALGEYAHFFHPDILAVTGAAKQLDLLSQSVGALYVLNKTDGDNYGVDHSTAVYVIQPDGRLRAVMPAPQKAETMLADLQQLMELN